MEETQRVAHWLETLDFSAWRFSEKAYSSWLKLRDAEPFGLEVDGAWRLINEREGNPLSPNELEVLECLREAAFAKALEATGNDEVATCVGEDFEMLARAGRVGWGNGWLKSLRHRYEQVRFPYGTLGSL